MSFQVRKQFLRTLYISSHPGQPSRENELVTAKTFDLDNLMEGVARPEFLLHVPPPTISKRSGLIEAAPTLLRRESAPQFFAGSNSRDASVTATRPVRSGEQAESPARQLVSKRLTQC
jgi:hypothetical protein